MHFKNKFCKALSYHVKYKTFRFSAYQHHLPERPVERCKEEDNADYYNRQQKLSLRFAEKKQQSGK